MEIERKREIEEISERIQRVPVVALLGPRQCGKTTLARQFAKKHPQQNIHLFDLEDPLDLERLANPTLALRDLEGIAVIDEIQRRPELFPVLRVLVDRPQNKLRYLILGSASRDLIHQSSETLAGRISYYELGGFSLILPAIDQEKLWARGSFPRSYLATKEEASFEWRKDFIITFLERDIPALGIHIPSATLRRFWMMLAHYHGQIFNASEVGKSMDANDVTMKRYLDILAGTFMIRRLQPWFYNTKKRLVKRPKIYFRDSGIFHTLLSIRNGEELRKHPKLGASWEGFALEQTIQLLGLKEEDIFFWQIHGGASLDVLFQRGGKNFGIEVKFQEAPSLTKSMASAVEELSLEHLWVVYPREKKYALSPNISVVPLEKIRSLQLS